MKTDFKSPMRLSERILGCVYIPVHAVLSIFIVHAFWAIGISFTNVYLMLVYYALSFVFVLLITFRFLLKSFSDLLAGPVRVLQSVILGYALFFAMSLAVGAVLSRLIEGQANPNSAEIMNMVRYNKGIMMFVTVVLAPIIEETMFRGALFGSIRQKNRLLAYIVSALLFSIYHLWQFAITDFNWSLLLFSLEYIAASIALAWCYEHGRTIWAPIFLHAAINFISTVIT